MTTVKKILAFIAQAKNATVAAGVVTLLVQLLPGVNIPGPAVAGILVAVGTIASVIETEFFASLKAKLLHR